MYNATKPTDADLPTTGQLLRSTAIALAAAAVILVTIVLPSEYAIDPTGVGGALGLKKMGEIKQQLAAETLADEQTAAAALAPAPVVPPPQIAAAEEPAIAAVPPPEPAAEAAPAPEQAAAPPGKSDEVSFTLKPAQGAEYKMTMREGAKANFTWAVTGGIVNYDLHGTATSGSETSYRKGRAVETDSGELVAAFDGAHGWFWRNKGQQDITITLKTSGDYMELKRVK